MTMRTLSFADVRREIGVSQLGFVTYSSVDK